MKKFKIIYTHRINVLPIFCLPVFLKFEKMRQSDVIKIVHWSVACGIKNSQYLF